MKDLQVMLIGRPTDEDWINVKRRALITIYGDHEYFVPPGSDWKHRILAARHSPIRYLRYSFCLKESLPILPCIFAGMCTLNPIVAASAMTASTQWTAMPQGVTLQLI